jgi:uncharacterized protein YjdB
LNQHDDAIRAGQLRASTFRTIAAGVFGILSLGLLSACGSSKPVGPGLTAGIEIAPGEASIGVGQTQAYTARARDNRGNTEPLDPSTLSWDSSDDSVATIDAQGVATALTAGRTEIRAYLGDDEAVAFLTVRAGSTASLAIEPASLTLAAGRQQTLRVYATDDAGARRDVSDQAQWSSAATNVATVDDAGTVTAQAPGSTQISARYDEQTANATVTVTAAEFEALQVQPSALSLAPGEVQQLSAIETYSNGTRIDRSAEAQWSSDDAAVAQVDAGGVLTAQAGGSTQVHAQVGGHQGSATVEVVAGGALPFRIGAAETSASFLPEPGSVCLGGYDTFCGRDAQAEHDPLRTGAVAITGDGESSFILVKTSNIGYFAAYKAGNGPNGLYDIRQRIAQRLAERYGAAVVPADHIVVTSDHSHHAPDTIGIWGGLSSFYMALLAESAVDAGVQAYVQRVPARLYASSIQGPPTAGSYAGPPTDDPDREFRVLFAEDRAGRRIATLMNYAPHATVLPSSNVDATGDWTAWAAQIAAETTGGVGIGLVGALGAMDWNKTGDAAERETEARARLRALLDASFSARSEVDGDTVAVKTVFVREPLAQPILLANYAPRVTLPGVGASLSIERAEAPPWNTGAVIGTYASAVRLGDVFIGTMPGEPFPQLHYALRDCDTLPEGIESDTDCGGISGARVNFLLGAANDFLGYMLYTPEQYLQAFQEGALYFGGCPEEQLLEALGLTPDSACPDHWALMVSPTIGRHMVCTVQNAAEELGFDKGPQNAECPLLTALDGIAAPAEYPAAPLLPATPAEFLDSPAAGVVAACRDTGAPEAVCAGLETVSEAIGDQLAGLIGDGEPVPQPSGVSRAGVAVRDASWHLGASAGQFADTGLGIAHDRGFDPYVHSVKKVGSDLLGTRVTTRALVIEDSNGHRVGVAANDLYLPNDFLHRRTVQLLAEHDRQVLLGVEPGPVSGLTDGNLATTSSHSHTSPFYSTPGWGTWIFQDVMDLRFYEYMAQQMADAVMDAVRALRPVRMGGITMHSNDTRSHTYGPKTAYDGTPAGQPYDYTTQQISVLRFDDISEPGNPKPYANWVIFGVHPEWVWGEEIVNGDITHALMRVLDRETGATTVMSQRETGASGPHKDTRVHPPAARREFQESNFSGYDRAARLLADTVLDGLKRIEDGRPQDPTQFAAFSSQFAVAYASERFAPPLSQPVPTISNCLSDPLFAELHPGLPLLGFPDCFYDVADATAPVIDPLLDVLPIDPAGVRDQLLAAGIPVPATYGFPSLTAIQETAAVHLQVFKLGTVVATMCPCEQFTSQALNIASRLDRVAGNVWEGFDWACVAEARSEREVDARFAAHCARQNARYPEIGVEIPGSFDNADDVERLRAQIHNDAAGWEDPAYALWAQSEPLEPSEIKGNFTHEEFPAQGYDLVLSVGMANDYWGYMPEYREMRAHDHYRKALNALGQHGADFLATRLSRMAAKLNGADTETPYNPLDALYQAESLRAEAFAGTLGVLARSYMAAFDLTVPADGGEARVIQQPEPLLPRFGAATVRFVGGSNYSGSPKVRVERLISGSAEDGEWETYGTQEGEVQLQLRFLPTLGGAAIPDNPVTDTLDAGGSAAIPDPVALVQWRAGLFEWEWTASFEAFVSELPSVAARPAVTPEGVYRFVIDGQKRGIMGLEDYQLESTPFTVVPWGGITVDDLRVEADGRVSFAVGPVHEVREFRDSLGTDAGSYTVPEDEPGYVVGPIDYPDSYEGGLSWIDPRRNIKRYNSEDRAQHQQYCNRCSFRPWADTADVASATITVRHAGGTTSSSSAQRDGERWISTGPIAAGDTAYVDTRGIVDRYGEFNGAPSQAVTR